MPLKNSKASKLKDLYLNESHPPGFFPRTINTLNTKLPTSKEIGMLSVETQVLRDPLVPVLLSSKYPKQQILEEVVPLNEYKFDQSRLVLVKRTPKRKKTLVEGKERVSI